MRVAIVGCGNIAARYAASIAAEPTLELVAATDLSPGRADAFVAEHGGASHPSLESLLTDDAVELVVNLTAPQAHAAVTAMCLEAGKHVHSEKPLALRYDEASALVDLAARHGVRLSCAPATLLGEAQQTAWKLVRDRAIGRVRAVYAESNWGRIEEWHPHPIALYGVGPLVDVGIYPLAIVTAILGPVRRVVAQSAVLEPDRTTLSGAEFRLDAPDFVVAVLELGNGAVARLTASFYVGPSKQRGVEFHGDTGSVHLASWGEADSRVELQQRGAEYEPVSLPRAPHHGFDWGRALVDLADALEENRPHRAGAEHAAHLVEVLEGIERSSARGVRVEIRSDFPQPAPMDWAT